MRELLPDQAGLAVRRQAQEDLQGLCRLTADVHITARRATEDDLDVLLSLYDGLEAEQTKLKYMWPLADGLPAPVSNAMAAAISDPDTAVVVGEIEGCVFGFALARVEGLLPQADGERIGSIRLIYTDPPAREVGVAETMMGELLSELRSRGLQRFDAHVLPGHRLAKNFFEASGFAARSIVMHHADE